MKRLLFEQSSKSLLFLLFVFSVLYATAQEIQGDVENGKKIFKINCASCHQLNRKMIGPALTGITERRTTDWLIKWISDNQKLRTNGDAEAIAIFEEYNGSMMTAFPNLSESDIMDILAYTIEGDKPKDRGTEAEPATVQVAKDDNTVLLLILGGILLFIIILMAKVKNTLKQVKGESTSTILEDVKNTTRLALKSRRILTLLTIIVGIIFTQQLYYGLMNISVHQNYQPEQPIKFSHKLHAGDNQIDCNYCHYGAQKGKYSIIPSANICMNCHMYIQEGPKYGKEEIAKIYAAVGYDPNQVKYIEGYEQKPIKWVRIHNLPDLAYFNHSQHVTAGQIACQTCHGPVQKMEKVYQYSSLTMDWCINCHLETQVQVENNDYYTEMHEHLKKKYGANAKITVEMIGGLECGKCHY